LFFEDAKIEAAKQDYGGYKRAKGGSLLLQQLRQGDTALFSLL
jgi:hypothetical protein